MAKKKDKAAEAEAAGAAEPQVPVVRISAHPRARASIRRARGIAGMAGVVIVLLVSLRAGVPAFDACLRALIGGIAAHFVAWFAAQALWKRLIVAGLELAHRRLFEPEEDDDAPARA